MSKFKPVKTLKEEEYKSTIKSAKIKHERWDKLDKNQCDFSQGVLLYITLVLSLPQYIQKTECHFDNPTIFTAMKLFMKVQKLSGFSTRTLSMASHVSSALQLGKHLAFGIRCL